MATRLGVLALFFSLFLHSGIFSTASSQLSLRRSLARKPSKHSPPAPISPPPPIRQETSEWCVAQPTESSKTLAKFIVHACKTYEINCDNVKPRGYCYFQGDSRKRASYVLSLIYVKHRTCLRQYGVIQHTDPSQNRCLFPSVDH